MAKTAQDRQELNRKLAEFLKEHTDRWNWLGEKPKGDFTTDLSLCFKWLVPKLNGWTLAKHKDEAEYKASVLICGKFGDKISPTTYAETPALALCLAISKMIEQEGVND